MSNKIYFYPIEKLSRFSTNSWQVSSWGGVEFMTKLKYNDFGPRTSKGKFLTPFSYLKLKNIFFFQLKSSSFPNQDEKNPKPSQIFIDKNCFLKRGWIFSEGIHYRVYSIHTWYFNNNHESTEGSVHKH